MNQRGDVLSDQRLISRAEEKPRLKNPAHATLNRKNLIAGMGVDRVARVIYGRASRASRFCTLGRARWPSRRVRRSD